MISSTSHRRGGNARPTSRRRLALIGACAVVVGTLVSNGAVGALPPIPTSPIPVPAPPPSPISTPLTTALGTLTGYLATECTSSAIANNPGLATPCTNVAEQAGNDAYLYGIALMEFLRQRRQQTSVTVPNTLADAPVNQLGSARELASATAGHQVFVQPNNDTLYTMGHLDLTAGPMVLHVPAMAGHRYYVFEFLDPYTNVFNYVGTRTTGDGAGDYAITGPNFHGRIPAGLKQIRAAYNRVWLAGRTLVNGPGDLPAVHRVQEKYRLIPLADFTRYGLSWHPPAPKVVISTHTKATEPTGVKFFDDLGTALAQNPAPARDQQILAELRTIGIGPGLHPSTEHLSAAVLAGLAKAADNGYEYVHETRTTYAAESAVQHHGWFVPSSDTGDFGTDYTWRAIVALFGLAANKPAEAIYVIGVVDQTEQQLDGANAYVIHFPAGGLPPAHYFWSLTMYDDSFYLVPNPINRYSIGNRTPGVVYNSDGSLDVYLQHTAPAGHESNWLPAPASGTFEVTLRMYGPDASALNDTYTYPTIQRTLG
jgi:hypothetical protein